MRPDSSDNELSALRSASATERKSASAAKGPSRVNSARTRDYEQSTARDAGSPLSADGLDNGYSGFQGSRKASKQADVGERRKEKTTVTTTETYLTKRSPLKERLNAVNRGNTDGRPRSMGSPTDAKKKKDVERGRPLSVLDVLF